MSKYNTMNEEVKIKFPIGSRIKTTKGDRFVGPFEAVVIGYSKWQEYDSVIVQKDNGRKVACLAKNLIKID